MRETEQRAKLFTVRDTLRAKSGAEDETHRIASCGGGCGSAADARGIAERGRREELSGICDTHEGTAWEESAEVADGTLPATMLRAGDGSICCGGFVDVLNVIRLQGPVLRNSQGGPEEPKK